MAANRTSLDFRYSDVFTPKPDYFAFDNVGDFTQLGLQRGRFPDNQCFPLVQGLKFKLTGFGNNIVFKSMVSNPNDLVQDVILTVDTTSLRPNKYDDDAIRNLQKAIDPNKSVTEEVIVAQQEWTDFMDEVGLRTMITFGQVKGILENRMSNDTQFRKFLDSLRLLSESEEAEEERRTLIGFGEEEAALEVKVTALAEMPRDTFFILINNIKDQTEGEKQALQMADFLYAIKDIKKEQWTKLVHHPAAQSTVETIKGRLTSAAFTMPEKFENIFDDDKSFENFNPRYESNNNALSFHSKFVRRLREFAIYCVSLIQAAENMADRNREFAFSRMLVVKHNLHLDKGEVTELIFDDSKFYDIIIDDFNFFNKASAKPEMYYLGIISSIISFLKSGHHATAFNIDNTFTRLCGAMNVEMTIDRARVLLPGIVYHGPHIASTRLAILYMNWRGSRDMLSNAIILRLRPAPPTYAAVCNLEIFIEALANSKFFDYTEKAADYERFKTAMREIRGKMHYASPYSQYLYGKNLTIPAAALDSAKRMASYAAAMKEIMPLSTLTLSPALQKLATQGAQNSLVDEMLVTAYVQAFRRFYRTRLEASMERSADRRGRIALT